jgi:quercetin dioxygenase-like cupin family protein
MECYLKSGEVIQLDGGEVGLKLRCTTGQLWLTKNDGQDYLIRTGKNFELPAGEKALIEALNPAGIFVLKNCPTPAMGTVRLATC